MTAGGWYMKRVGVQQAASASTRFEDVQESLRSRSINRSIRPFMDATRTRQSWVSPSPWEIRMVPFFLGGFSSCLGQAAPRADRCIGRADACIHLRDLIVPLCRRHRGAQQRRCLHKPPSVCLSRGFGGHTVACRPQSVHHRPR